MSTPTFKCRACGRRIRRGRQANIRIRERESGRERRYHGARSECLQDAALFMSRHSRNSLTIHYSTPQGVRHARRSRVGVSPSIKRLER